MIRRTVFQRSIAPKSRAQTDLESHSRLAAPAFSAPVYFEGRFLGRPRRIRLLRQHGLVRTSDSGENARAAGQSVSAARRPKQGGEGAQNDPALKREVPI